MLIKIIIILFVISILFILFIVERIARCPLKNERAPATSEDQLQYIPPNYATCYDFIKAFLGIMGYGMVPEIFLNYIKLTHHYYTLL